MKSIGNMSSPLQGIKRWLINSRRLLGHSVKPSGRELWATSRITLFGILVMGLIGYVIHWLISTLTANLSNLS